MKRREMIVLPHCKHHDRVAQTPALLLLYRGTRTRPKQHDERMNECCCPASHSPPSPFVVASCGSRVPPFVAWLPSQPTVSFWWRSPSQKVASSATTTTSSNVAKNASAVRFSRVNRTLGRFTRRWATAGRQRLCPYSDITQKHLSSDRLKNALKRVP
jgi:hypothetical protein